MATSTAPSTGSSAIKAPAVLVAHTQSPGQMPGPNSVCAKDSSELASPPTPHPLALAVPYNSMSVPASRTRVRWCDRRVGRSPRTAAVTEPDVAERTDLACPARPGDDGATRLL